MIRASIVLIVLMGLSSGFGKSVPRSVIELSYKGGGRRPALPTPFLAVDSSGRLEIHFPDRNVRSQIKPKQVADILDSAKRDGFFDLDSTDLRTSIRGLILASGRRLPRLLDQSTTSLSLADGSEMHTVDVYALAEYAKLLPEHKELQSIAEMVRGLEFLISSSRNVNPPNER